jgi:hypothetical protein
MVERIQKNIPRDHLLSSNALIRDRYSDHVDTVAIFLNVSIDHFFSAGEWKYNVQEPVDIVSVSSIL